MRSHQLTHHLYPLNNEWKFYTCEKRDTFALETSANIRIPGKKFHQFKLIRSRAVFVRYTQVLVGCHAFCEFYWFRIIAFEPKYANIRRYVCACSYA